ncbi:hypothetical protein LOD99_13925 [Oopsacas minuta]|uniref:NADAR domain-containing protein n=1 Tax=Oopsacas minuta TaxID=111878 RepID=A0AAV7KGA0_9METZ|nr:hypothetical protein LOD99_13925 [Oopsacas minuta]
MATSRTQFTTEQDDPLVFLNLGFPLTVEIEDKEWPTIEHYYLAMKFPEEEQQDKIRTARLEDARLMAFHASPGALSEVEIDEVLLRALRAKFSQYPNLAKSLGSIRDHVIVLKDKDPYLGNGNGTGKCGQNKLGILLAFMRKEINDNASKYLEEVSDSSSESDTEPCLPQSGPLNSVTFQSPPTLLRQDHPSEGYMGSREENQFIGFNHQLPPLPEYYKTHTTTDVLSGMPPFSHARIKHTSIL